MIQLVSGGTSGAGLFTVPQQSPAEPRGAPRARLLPPRAQEMKIVWRRQGADTTRVVVVIVLEGTRVLGPNMKDQTHTG